MSKHERKSELNDEVINEVIDDVNENPELYDAFAGETDRNSGPEKYGYGSTDNTSSK